MCCIWILLSVFSFKEVPEKCPVVTMELCFDRQWILTVLCQSFLNKRAFPAGLQYTITNFLCCQLVAWQKLDFIKTLKQLLDTNHNWQTVHWWYCLCRPARWLTLIKLNFKTTAFTGDSASWKSYQKTENGTWLNLIFDLRWLNSKSCDAKYDTVCERGTSCSCR